ncbi:MAG: flagellar motor switch protein FliN [Gammaproteobacteria bacterium]|nr:flagellar motor switch protein FliN [Gammaproteobacteria bacterium]|tara:strand:+ start:1107 stop:1451 length:345 start_codon:yes stop_codon:yes gene_type:complete
MSDDISNAPTTAVAEGPEGQSFHEVADAERNLEVVMDIPVRLSMEVGSASVSIRRLLQLNRGSVVELDRLAGEPLDVLVNGKLIAHGEVVVVNDKFGIRLHDVVSAKKRIETLS